mmetsp:Transcript_17472/g.30417  ORF Transcript_17472/g.30417 Transcript_17472/m.30417 type:complete len:203 (-) Transcript_17472:187-795(-)
MLRVHMHVAQDGGVLSAQVLQTLRRQRQHVLGVRAHEQDRRARGSVQHILEVFLQQLYDVACGRGAGVPCDDINTARLKEHRVGVHVDILSAEVPQLELDLLMLPGVHVHPIGHFELVVLELVRHEFVHERGLASPASTNDHHFHAAGLHQAVALQTAHIGDNVFVRAILEISWNIQLVVYELRQLDTIHVIDVEALWQATA